MGGIIFYNYKNKKSKNEPDASFTKDSRMLSQSKAGLIGNNSTLIGDIPGLMETDNGYKKQMTK